MAQLKRAVLGVLLAGFAATAPQVAGEENGVPAVSSPALLIKAAGSVDDEKLGAVLQEAGVRSEVLTRFGRLLPEVLSATDRLQWATALEVTTAEGQAAFEKQAAALPKVDELIFDGQEYSGGNLSFIDCLLGKSGRPVAFDRALPSILVPLSLEAETAAVAKRTEFQAKAENAALREAATKTHGGTSADALFGDGHYLRPYAGRFDDLYFHLFQNGTGPSGIAFGALVDGLAQRRTYQPVNGVCQRSKVAPSSFDLSDILTDGGKAAVTKHLRSKYERPIEPFRSFAFRILPTIIAKARELPAGSRFTTTTPEMLKALRAREHFYPIQVPPIYKSADRFLGWAGSMFIPVATKPVLPPGAAESWFPLPKGGGRSSAESAADGASSSQLFDSNSLPALPANPDGTPGATWEDPQLSNLLAAPETKALPPSPPPGKSPSSPTPKSPGTESAPRVDPNDPRLRPMIGRFIAVVTPTVEEGAAYLVAIAASDEKLRSLEQLRGRVRLQRSFIQTAHTASASVANVPAVNGARQAMDADLKMIEQSEQALNDRMLTALQERAAVRTALEERLVRERVRPLEALGKKTEEARPSATPAKTTAGVNL